MKVFLVVLFMFIFSLAYTQGIYEYECMPDAPYEGIQVKVRFLVLTPWNGGRKQSGNWYIQEDTIFYRACYTLGGGAQTESYIPDTISLGLLASKVYHLRAVASFTPYPTDFVCDSIYKVDTLDTLIHVTKLTGINNVMDGIFSLEINGFFNINFESPSMGTINIQVYDALGQLHHSSQTEVYEGKNEIALDLPDLPSGLYLYHIQLGEQRRVLKFVKQ